MWLFIIFPNLIQLPRGKPSRSNNQIIFPIHNLANLQYRLFSTHLKLLLHLILLKLITLKTLLFNHNKIRTFILTNILNCLLYNIFRKFYTIFLQNPIFKPHILNQLKHTLPLNHMLRLIFFLRLSSPAYQNYHRNRINFRMA